MASQGPNSGGTFTTEAEAGGIPNWSFASNAASSDNSYALTVFSSGTSGNSNRLKITNFGFSIPGGATINGVTVEIERKASTASFNPKDFSVKLVKGGVVSGNNKATATVWPTTDTYATYGGSADLWGLTLSVSDINDSTFGMIISIQADATFKSSVSFSVDHVRITINYTSGGVVSSGSALAFFL